MDESDDAKTKITDKLSQIYKNTFLSTNINTESFKDQLMKRLKFFKKKLDNKNKTNKKRSILRKTVKTKRSKNVPPNN
jgi:hypothetical protein